ncbi:hypothetical protein J2Z40_000219 [Cytobacillus eiseniae]|uniref:DUF1836 domain-containing protein n=1 Tax=Cytobacillus eiseniae TaxID=762947 RepID=A0ABS4RB98_9BACI|nr:DUF1836 domain-containing protein [Cytobacillus eiseniae]MBP2239666.1 hypothetical protein [Cytobacillus eiseniae]
MENLQQMIIDLELHNQITLEDMPQIDLYMDQVIQLFENQFGGSKRNEDEKVLTKTMINNYAKGKLFFPIKNKKYSKDHLILISLIYQLKGALSINDIKDTLLLINEKTLASDFALEHFYESYLQIVKKNVERFNENVSVISSDVKKEIEEMKDLDQDRLEKIMMISSLSNMSNFYRRAAEKLVDELGANKELKEKKKNQSDKQ